MLPRCAHTRSGMQCSATSGTMASSCGLDPGRTPSSSSPPSSSVRVPVPLLSAP